MPGKRVRAVMWRDQGVWRGRILPDGPERFGRTRGQCAASLRRTTRPSTLDIEVVPELVGVAEAAEILGWDKRRVFTYISRNSFPEPVAMLASGRGRRREDIEAYARRPRNVRPTSREGPPS